MAQIKFKKNEKEKENGKLSNVMECANNVFNQFVIHPKPTNNNTTHTHKMSTDLKEKVVSP